MSHGRITIVCTNSHCRDTHYRNSLNPRHRHRHQFRKSLCWARTAHHCLALSGTTALRSLLGATTLLSLHPRSRAVKPTRRSALQIRLNTYTSVATTAPIHSRARALYESTWRELTNFSVSGHSRKASLTSSADNMGPAEGVTPLHCIFCTRLYRTQGELKQHLAQSKLPAPLEVAALAHDTTPQTTTCAESDPQRKRNGTYLHQ